MKDMTVRARNGSTLSVRSDSNREESDYIMWDVAPTYAVGVLSNTPKTRRFLRLTLARLERDKKRVADLYRRRYGRVYKEPKE